MSKLLSAFTGQGNFDAELWYTVLFDEIPCKYCLSIEDPKKCLDPREIVFEKCQHLFKDVITTRQYTEEYEEDPEGEEIEFAEGTQVELPLEELEGHLRFNGERAGSLYIATESKRIFLVVLNKCSVYYSAKDSLEDIKKFVNELWNCFPKLQEEEKVARVGLIKYSNGEYYTSFSDIRKTTINIEENYNNDFPPVYKDIIEFLNQRESGLILCWGAPGTGKTSLIRHLCSNVSKDYVIVPNSVATRLADPDLMSYLTSCRDYVFILEDCEQLLVDREDNPWNNAITTILNMADGLLSDIVNIKFICTFNAKIDNIDPALLRKGRCFAKYEFKELAEDKVAALDAKYKLNLPEIKPMTLAEIYNSEKTDYSEDTKKPRKIGF